MNTTRERTVSGRALVIGGLAVAFLVTAASLVFGPGLRNDVRQDQRPRTLREPVAAGVHAGEPWEAVGRFDGTANCVELRYLSEVLTRACDTGPRLVVGELPDGPNIALGVADEDRTRYVLALDNGEQLSVPVRAGELGFPVGFWATELPDGVLPSSG